MSDLIYRARNVPADVRSLASRLGLSRQQAGFRFQSAVPAVAGMLLVLFWCPGAVAGPSGETIPDMSGKYEFLAPEDTLAVLEEDSTLKGYIDVSQSADESDSVLSYQITIGKRQADHVEFKTSKIHEKYYRFSGAVERGSGHKEAGPDYLRLVGDLEIVTVNGDTGQEHVERRRVIFKSKGRSDSDEE